MSALSAEVQALKAGQKAIQEELRTIKQLLTNLRRPQQPQAAVRDINATLDVGSDPFQGSPEARVTLVEFSDYQCPYCGRHTKTVLPQLVKNYVETGKVRYVLRDFPLHFHQYAAKAHEAAHCAGEQEKYWEMHQQLFGNQGALQREKLPRYAEAAGVTDLAGFQDCLDSGKYAARTKQSLADGAKAGVSGTPSFVLGLTQPDGSTVKLVKFIRGAQAYQVFQKAIDDLISSQKK